MGTFLNPFSPTPLGFQKSRDVHDTMMRDKILVVFALAWLYCSTGHGQTDTSIQCDDKRVEDVVNLTLSKHNEILTEGAQLALYEILEATKVGVLLFAFNNILQIYATSFSTTL